MIPLPLIAVAKGVWGFLRAVPWQAWAVAAVLLVGWRYGEHRYDAGVADENARWLTAQARADAYAKAAEEARDKVAEEINTSTSDQAHEATVDTRTDTATAVERVRYEIRTIEVPAGCPTDLPAGVRDEGRAAVDRARAAGGQVRAGRNP